MKLSTGLLYFYNSRW